MSDREILERFNGIDKRLDRMVPLDSWNLQNSHVAANLAELDRDCRERAEASEKANVERFAQVNKRFEQRDKRSEMSWTKILAVAGMAVTLIAAAIGAYATTKGIH